MKRTTFRVLLAAVLSVTLSLGLGVGVAYADLWGADLPILTSILTTTLQQLDTATKSFETLGRTYQETKRMAGYAADARVAYEEIRAFSSGRLASSGLNALYRAYPELSYLQGESQYGYRTWGQGYGTLSPELQMCLREMARDAVGGTGAPFASACDEWRKAITGQRLEQDLRRTFGELPQGRPEYAVLRAEDTAREQRYQVELVKKAAVEKQVYDPNDGMLARCSTARDPVVCQTLAAQAQIQALEQHAETNRKLEELIHQQTVANELKITEARRLEDEERARRASLVEGLRAFGWQGPAEPAAPGAADRPAATPSISPAPGSM